MPVVHVDIIIPHFNGLALLQDCLDSLARQKNVYSRIIVVDNGSTDGSVEWLGKQTEIIKIFQGHNTGFAAAVNAGIRYGSASFVFLLNNDTTLEQDTIAPNGFKFENRCRFSPKLFHL